MTTNNTVDGPHSTYYPNGIVFERNLEWRHPSLRRALTNIDESSMTKEYIPKKGAKYKVEYYEDGSKFEGEFIDNKKNGKGKYTFPDGTILQGEFKNDNPHQFCIAYFTNGDRELRVYDQNKIIRCVCEKANSCVQLQTKINW